MQTKKEKLIENLEKFSNTLLKKSIEFSKKTDKDSKINKSRFQMYSDEIKDIYFLIKNNSNISAKNKFESLPETIKSIMPRTLKTEFEYYVG